MHSSASLFVVFSRRLGNADRKDGKVYQLYPSALVQGMSMRRPWLYPFLGLAFCAGASLAQTPLSSESANPSPPAAEAAPRLWASAEYLLWNIPNQKLPMLVGTIPEPYAELVQRFPDSTITPLFGGGTGRIDYGEQSGVRLEVGCWLDDFQEVGLEAGYFQLQQGRQQSHFQSAAGAPLGLAYWDSAAGQQVLIMDAVPGLRNGTVAIDANNHLWGVETNALFRLPVPAFPGTLRFLAGFRHLQFDEGLSINSTSTLVPNGHLPCG
jgi:Putative beta barrel porin-7 (BBP7)